MKNISTQTDSLTTFPHLSAQANKRTHSLISLCCVYIFVNRKFDLFAGWPRSDCLLLFSLSSASFCCHCSVIMNAIHTLLYLYFIFFLSLLLFLKEKRHANTRIPIHSILFVSSVRRSGDYFVWIILTHIQTHNHSHTQNEWIWLSFYIHTHTLTITQREKKRAGKWIANKQINKRSYKITSARILPVKFTAHCVCFFFSYFLDVCETWPKSHSYKWIECAFVYENALCSRCCWCSFIHWISFICIYLLCVYYFAMIFERVPNIRIHNHTDMKEEGGSL